MGSIVDRSREHLGASDLAVIHFRRTIIDAPSGLLAMARRLSAIEPIDYKRLSSAEGMAPLGADWRMLGHATA